MVVKWKRIKRYLLVLFTCVFVLLLVLPSYAVSHETFDNGLEFPYVMFYDNINQELIACFGNTVYSNVNFGSLSPIGAAARLNGDTYTYFKLPYGGMFAGIVIYNTFSQTQGFYDSSDWFYFFNEYLSNNNNQSSAFTSVYRIMFQHFSVDNLRSIESDICKYGYLTCYLCFSDEFCEFIYLYSYQLLIDADMIDMTYDEYYNQCYKFTPMLYMAYDISRNPETYKSALYYLQTNQLTADYVPINAILYNYEMTSGFDPISTIFALLTSNVLFEWLPFSFVVVITTQMLSFAAIASFLFFKKMISFFGGSS